MPTVVNGLPAHVLLLHVVVVLIPLGALLAVVSAVWPAGRRRLGVVSPLVTLAALGFVPVTVSAGHWLKKKLAANGVDNAAIRHHAALGGQLLPWAAALFVLSAAAWWLGRTADRAVAAARSGTVADTDAPIGDPAGGVGTATLTRAPARTALPVWVTYAVAVLTVVVAVGTVWTCFRIGDSGAHAAWDYVKQLRK